MRRHPRRTVSPVIALATAAACLAMLPVSTARATQGATPQVAAPGAVSVRHVFLVDGSQLVVRRAASGGQEIALRPSARPMSVMSLRVGSRVQEISAEVLPYLGRGLDPSLIDLGALKRAETGNRLPVQITFTGRAPKLPGITVTRSGSGREQGYMTARGAAAFGAALVRQFRADHARASYGKDGMFAGGVTIALAGAPAARVARPRFQLHTLTTAATGLNGRPDTGDAIFVFNEDNPARFSDPEESFSVFYHGTAKFSVPAGHYWAVGDFISFNGNTVAERLAFLPQFTVRRNKTIHLSERAASSKIGFTVARPATLQQSGFTLIRGAGNGTTFTFGFFDSGLSLWVSPTTRKPSIGTLQSFTSGQLTSSRSGANAAYVYNLNYQGPPGIIPAAQHFDATPASLATVTEDYVQDVRTHGGWGVFGGFKAELGLLFATIYPLSLPHSQTQYFNANPSLAWSTFYFEFLSFSRFGGGQSDAFRVFSGGQQLTEDWNNYPLHPQPDVQPLGGAMGAALPAFVSASRSGNTLNLATAPFSDNYPGHQGSPAFSFSSGKTLESGSYAIYQNGVRLARGNPLNGIKPVQLSSKPSTIKFVLSGSRPQTAFPLSTTAQTVWTWRSAPKPGATVPRNWFCGFSRRGLSRHCAVQPMMTLDYHVGGLGSDGLTSAGAQLIDLNAGHIQLAASARITGVTAQVSYNDGQTFQPANVTSVGGDRFRISFNAPAGVDVTLRVSAADAAGGSITETILRAYGVAS
ncbi:MAG: hypothetical protein ACTHJW_12605 [Streptosporangiaceae bacterium]